MKKTKLTRSLMAAVSIVALSAVMYGCVHSGDDAEEPVVEMPDPDPNLVAAQGAAAAAAAAADTAADDAEEAVMAQMANQAADPASYGAAQAAAKIAREAADAAAAASTAAAATDDTGMAQQYSAAATTALTGARSARDSAEMYAGMVATAHQAAVAENQRMMDVTAARTAAMGSSTAADGHATMAETQADEAEATAPGTPGAMAARTAAMAARTAATAAKAALDAITDGMTKAEADAQAAEAATQAGHANAGYMTAKSQNDAIQTASTIGEQQQEAQALMDAREATQEAADEVAEHLTAVQGKAADARAQAQAARTAANAAKAARRDYESADEYATMAEAESAKAQAALTRAMQANTDAQAALTAAMNAATSADAEAEQAKAEAANDIATEAHTGDTGAGMAYMAAKSAAEKAVEAAGENVLALLGTANADHIVGAASQRAHRAAVRAAINLEAADTTTTDTSPNAAGAATTVAATWRYHGDLGTLGDSANRNVGGGDDTKPGEGMLALDISVGGTAADLVRDNPDTAGIDESNFVKLGGIGDFAEYHIAINPASPAVVPNTRVLVFTDKEQAAAPIAGGTANFQNAVPIASQLSAFTGTSATYDHDGNPNTAAIAVTVSCPENVTCSAPEDADGNVTSVTGYRISTDAAGVTVAAVAEDENNTYLAFGVWLTEVADASSPLDGVRDYTFGAFGVGGTEADTPASIEGTATYNGSAAGLHTTPGGTSLFTAAATLTADFDVNDGATPPVDVPGAMVTGRIHNIVSGGQSVSDSIYLDMTAATANNANADTNGDFGGRARMGSGVTDPGTGNILYPYNGT